MNSPRNSDGILKCFFLIRTEKGYPLIIENGAELIVEESPVDNELVLKLLPKLDYSALLGAINNLREQSVGFDIPELPPAVPDNPAELDDETIAKFHKVLFDIHLVKGHLICPDTGRKFPVKDGIPNMILHEDEV